MSDVTTAVAANGAGVTLSEEQRAIRETIGRLCEDFGAEYWYERDHDGEFPEEFLRAVVEGGWLGIAMPEEYGGAGLGITEASVMMQAIAESGAAFSGASAVHLNIFGLNPVVVAGTEEQKARMLPPLIRGENRACFAVTEPNAGLDTTNITTTATRTNSGYVVNGRKIWTSTAQTADKVLLLARTSPKPANGKRAEGLTLFYTDFDRATSRRARSRRWGARRSTATRSSLTGCRCRRRTGSGRRARASTTSCTASTRNGSWSPSRRWGSRGRPSGEPASTRGSGRSSAARSARTRPSPTLSRVPGRRSRRRT